jgi:tetratricopeptide (TPR) repeat protein
MKKKIKEQLKGDEFVSLVTRAIQVVKSRTKAMLAVVAGICVILLIFLGIKYIQAQSAKRESQTLGKIIQINSELNSDPTKLAELEKLGGGGKFSRIAYLKIAAYQFEQEDFDAVLEALGKIPESNKDLTYYQAQDLKAQVFIAQKKYDEALAIYQEIEDQNPKDYSLDVVLFQKAKIIQEMGDPAQALEIFKRIKQDFPQTFYGYEATQEIARLEEKM